MRLIEFHEALFNRIRATLDERVGLYDYLPTKEPMPFVVLAEMVAEETDELASKTGGGYAVVQKISIATRAKEKKWALTILKQIQTALEAPLVVEGTYQLRQKFLDVAISETEDAKYDCETHFEIWLLDQEEL